MKPSEPPVPSSEAVSGRMSRQRRRDTAPEVELRRRLHRLGYRFRVNYPVPGLRRRSIDIAFTKAKVAVFVDGCFWHACPEHASWPASNAAWWQQKLRKNAKRDAETDQRLTDEGWKVVRVWEHSATEDAVQEVLTALPER